MISIYEKNLLDKVKELSEDKSSWENAVREWEIIDHMEDYTATSSCICGNHGLRYLFTIKNSINGKTLFPIGSSCINKFGRKELDIQTSLLEELYELYHAIENDQYITLESKYFPKKLIKYFYENDVFEGNRYNNYDGYIDYEFLLEMFNKRNKDTIGDRQAGKVNALIMVIRAYFRKNFAHRVIHY